MNTIVTFKNEEIIILSKDGINKIVDYPFDAPSCNISYLWEKFGLVANAIEYGLELSGSCNRETIDMYEIVHKYIFSIFDKQIADYSNVSFNLLESDSFIILTKV